MKEEEEEEEEEEGEGEGEGFEEMTRMAPSHTYLFKQGQKVHCVLGI
jgi:hypothetical protein